MHKQIEVDVSSVLPSHMTNKWAVTPWYKADVGTAWGQTLTVYGQTKEEVKRKAEKRFPDAYSFGISLYDSLVFPGEDWTVW